MAKCFGIAILSLVISLLDFGDCARILAVCPTMSISHQVVVHGLAGALNKRGHDLVVVTTNPLNDPNLTNYREIDLSFLYQEATYYDTNFIENRGKQDMTESSIRIASMVHTQTENILSHPKIRELIAPNNNEKFDLILLEMIFWHAFLALGARFNAPIIGFTTMGPLLNTHYGMGNPILPSHPSHWEQEPKVSGSLIPWKRLDNFVRVWRCVYWFENEFVPKQEAIAKKYFGADIPSLHDLHKNISLLLVTQQLPISWTRPNLPNVIEISSFHLAKQVKPLPKDLQMVLDEARQGFVYMSLGSNVKSRMLSNKLRGEFVAAFSQLPYKVIWKFENDTIPNKPENVMILKWTPQEAILAHPNIKVFIYQGGAQSTEEAISHAVPLVGLPVMGDQDAQINKLVDIGVAKKLEITTINRYDLFEAINTVATDYSYKQKMVNLRTLLKDRPHDLLDNAIWWMEHVIRHQGAPYLRASLADEPWYQQGDIDIIFFLSAATMIILSLLLVIIYKLLAKLVGSVPRQSYVKKMKLT